MDATRAAAAAQKAPRGSGRGSGGGQTTAAVVVHAPSDGVGAASRAAPGTSSGSGAGARKCAASEPGEGGGSAPAAGRTSDATWAVVGASSSGAPTTDADPRVSDRAGSGLGTAPKPACASDRMTSSTQLLVLQLVAAGAWLDHRGVVALRGVCRDGRDAVASSIQARGTLFVAMQAQTLVRRHVYVRMRPATSAGLRTCLSEHVDSLCLSYAPFIDDDALRAVGASCPRLHSLDLDRSQDSFRVSMWRELGAITDAGIAAVLDGCPLLYSLDLCFCSKLSGMTARNIGAARCAPHLMELNLDDTHVENEGLAAIAARCTQLRSLSLQDAYVTNVGPLGEHKLPLETLRLFRVRTLEPDGLTTLIRGCGATLKCLDMGGCRQGVNDSHVELLADTTLCPGLRMLSVRCASTMTAQGLGRLEAALPFTDTVHCVPCE